jgi:hypothetical protein
VKLKSPLVFKLEKELNQRLETCAERLRLKKYTLGIMAIQAAIEAIEKNDYRLTLPVTFRVEDIPIPASQDTSFLLAAEKPPPYGPGGNKKKDKS